MPIATVSGIALSPGVSRNNRLYTADAIAKAVVRAQARIGEGVRPVSMRSHHAAGDDSTRITGHLTEMTLDRSGRARFAGVIEATTAGRDIATLADDRGKPPSLRGLSIRGAWLGPVRQVVVDGRQCETADDLEIVGLDWTGEPGVDDAGVEQIEFIDTPADPEETTVERHPITESAEEASVTITEHTPTSVTTTTSTAAAPVAESARPSTLTGQWADRGYHGPPRWPLNTPTEARAAWSALGESADGYTTAQVKRMRNRIKSALTRHGVGITTEGWLIDTTPRPVTEAVPGTAVAEHWCDDSASVYVSISNGCLSISVSSYDVEPGSLDAIARAAMAGACQALATIDAEGGSDDGSGDATDETAPAAAVDVNESATHAPDAEQADGTETNTREAAVSEPTDNAAAAGTSAAPSITLTGDQFAQLLDRIAPPQPPATVPPVESAPAPAVAESTPAAAAVQVTETEEQRIDRIVAERVAAARTEIIQEVARTLPVGRRGLVSEAAGVAAGGAAPDGLPGGLAQKPLHSYDESERAAFDRFIAGAVLPAAAMTTPPTT